jgi:hypothetical protein
VKTSNRPQPFRRTVVKRGRDYLLNDIERNSIYHHVIDLLQAYPYFRDIGVLYLGKLVKKIVGLFLPLQRNRELEVLWSCHSIAPACPRSVAFRSRSSWDIRA